MKRLLFVVLVLSGSANLSGCANNSARLEGEISRLEKNVADLRNIQAESTSVISSIRSDLRSLQGRMEEIEYNQNRLSALKRDLSSLQQRVPPPKEVPLEALEEDESYITKLSLNNAETFKNAFQQIRLANYSDAILSLNNLLEVSSGEEWAPLVVFWLAVCYEGNANTEKALTAYQDLSSAYPKHPRVPLALLRQGTAFLRLGDKEPAKLCFKKILALYPRSKEAAIAKQKLQNF